MKNRPTLAGCLSLVAGAVTAAPANAQPFGYEPNIGDFFIALYVGVGLILMIPTIIAFYRNHPNRWLIGAINAVFGPTLLGWLVCLVWALSAAHRSPTGSHGGESGLNLFANDVQTIRLVQAPEAIASSVEGPAPQHPQKDDDDAAQLKRIRHLFDQGLLDENEYARFKGQIIERILAR